MKRSFLIVFLCAIAFATWRADSFIDLWLSNDQQARIHYAELEFVAAAREFDDSYKKGLAYYAAEDFSNAINAFSRLESAQANFYLGNSYAHL